MNKSRNYKKMQLLTFLIFMLPFVNSELSSCYRARCTHCTVEFIEKMCPSTCGLCQINSKLPYLARPKIRLGRPNYPSNENARVHAATKIALFSEENLKHKLASYEISKTRSLPPIAQLPNSNTYIQNRYNYQLVTQKPHSSYQNQLQQYYLQPSQATSFGSSYSVINSNIPSQQTQSQPYETLKTKSNLQETSFQQTSAFLQPQQAFLSQSQQIYGQNNAAQNPQIKTNEFYNFYQSPNAVQRTPFISSFQPLFLQPFQTAVQPSIFPTFPPSVTGASFFSTPLTVNNKYNSIQTATNSELQLSNAQNNIGTYSKQFNYQKQNIFTNDNQQQQYSYLPQSINPLFSNQNSKLIPSQKNQAVPYSLPVTNHETIQKTINVSTAPNIDKNPTYINKNAFGEKSGGQYLTCPKQPNWEPCVSKEIANKKFFSCCQKLGDGCSQLCSYDQTLATIQIAVLTGRCPLSKVADMMICASGYEDATPCCQAHNVFAPGFEHCRPYCNPSAGLPNDGMLAEKYRCLGKLSEIQRCFYVTQKP